MKQIALSIILLVCIGHVAGHVHAQVTLDQRIGELSKQISDGLTENQKQTIAVVEFVDLEGRVTNFGRFVAEELITRLYQTKKFKVIERQLLNKIVAEQKLSLGGMIDQTSAQKLGKLLGVDAIASGTVTDLGKSLRINARLISTGTGEVFAVAATEVAKDDSVMALMGAGGTGPTGTSPGTSGSAPSYKGNAIASKDLGSLRVVLKSVMRVKIARNYSMMNGIRCAFEFINLETQRPIVVAMNAVASSGVIGSYLRSTLVDENGGLWHLYNADVAGMSIVGVGQQASGFRYDPAEIVTVLSKRDDLNSDDFNVGGTLFRFIFGSTTEMSSGQSLTVTMTFVDDGNQTTSGASPKVFQMATEIVVGVEKSGAKKSYTLHNFTFDQVSMRAGAQ
ncbi:MAG TPA: FlgO family outer membrane protein [Pyrinomonadaceae bacterium]|nr:FlgO family outer membrane protein [Pyrinomonadaceae bacterium]